MRGTETIPDAEVSRETVLSKGGNNDEVAEEGSGDQNMKEAGRQASLSNCQMRRIRFILYSYTTSFTPLTPLANPLLSSVSGGKKSIRLEK